MLSLVLCVWWWSGAVCGCLWWSVGAVGAVSGSLVLSCCLFVSRCLVLSLVVFSGVGGLWVRSGVLCGSLVVSGGYLVGIWSVCGLVWEGVTLSAGGKSTRKRRATK